MLQLMCCCSTPGVDAPKRPVSSDKTVEAKEPDVRGEQLKVGACRAGDPQVGGPQLQGPGSRVCAVQPARRNIIDKIKERYGANPPHLATTVDGGKDLSL